MQKLVVVFLLLLSVSVQAQDKLPRRGFFGVQTQAVSDSIRAQWKNLPEGGVSIVSVVAGSSAEAAELKVGDVITAVNGKGIADPSAFSSALSRYKSGDAVAIELFRDGQALETQVALKEFPREKPDDFDVIYDSVPVDGALRRVIFTKPHQGGKLPLIFFLGGIGCYSLDLMPEQDHPYKTLLYAMTRAGFATLRVEKTGMGDSQGPPCAEQNFHDEVRGYVAAFRELPRFDFVDTSRIILLGHSMGGVVAPVLANQVPVQGIVAIATSGIWWVEYELINQRRQLLLAGTTPDSIEIAAREKELAMHLLLIEKKTPDEILKDHPELSDELQYPTHYTFIQDLADLNLGREWMNVTCKTLFVYGGADFVTDRGEHLYAVNLMNNLHPGIARFVEVPNMDHFFTRIESQRASFDNLIAGRPNREFSQEVIPVVGGWCVDLLRELNSSR
ncbi:alpha/beta fold hydrolase [bacterium]|nr:alpha/beta fold hydrolase [bacterium]MBU1983235.1 alpha/beta fold hydrolase [bacterium]